ncbi:BglG family transcription antiterminator [Liquorilactobacillus hordei]|uniref:BglG family transcription antiterminator n=1 Tax=Liquorilactobacillus hordei TaxID=468911 RepID=UPI0039E83A88
MTSLDNDIINYLHSRSEIKAKELALLLNITTRTVRNHVKAINQKFPGLILSSQNGYTINSSKRYDNSVSKGIENSIQNSNEEYLTMRLLRSSEAGESILNLANSLFVSESQLRLILKNLKKFVAKFNLQIKIQHYHVYLFGSERNKRKLILSLLYGKGNLQGDLKETLQKLVGNISMEVLYETIKNVCVAHQIYLTPYVMENIVMHYAIAIERIRNGKHVILDPALNHLSPQSVEVALASEIINKLPNNMRFYFHKSDIEQLAILFIGNTVKNSSSNTVEEFVAEDVAFVLHRVLKDVSENFLIELNKPEFFERLALHVQGLVNRSENGELISNSKAVEIKITYPIIYDIAVYIGSCLNSELKVKLNDSEIALLALHIGAFLDSSEIMAQKLKEKVYILAIIPEYKQILNDFISKIQNFDNSEIELEVTTNIFNQYNFDDFDLVIVGGENQGIGKNVITVHPLPTRNDLKKIENAVKKITSSKKILQLKEMFSCYLPAELVNFSEFKEPFSKINFLKYATKVLEKKQIVDHFFLNELLEREKMSSTAFPTGVVIPHSMHMNALKTKILIVKFEKPILWGEQKIKFAFVIAQNTKDAQIFNDFFQQLVEILSDIYNVDMLYNSNSSDELLDIIYQFMKNNLD